MKMYLYTLAALFLVLCVYYWWYVRPFYKRNLPFTWPIPLLGSNAKVLFRAADFPYHLQHLYNKHKGQPFCGIFDFATRIIMIRDPEVIKSITVKDFDHFVDHRATFPVDVELLMAKNVLVLKGQKWRTTRNMLSPAFTSSKMKFMFQLVSECGKQLTRHIDSQLQQKGQEVVKMEAKDLYTRLTNDVIATTAFGISCNSLDDKDNTFYKMGRKVANLSGIILLKFWLFTAFPSVMKLLRMPLFPVDATNFFRQLIYDTLRTRMAQGIVRPDMIHLLMEAKKVQADLTDDDIAAQAFVFFVAGFDTTSTLLSHATLLLAMHPEVQKKLQRHIDEVFDEEQQTISYEALHGMVYLDMVISETLRMYPPAPFMDRKCVKTYTAPGVGNRPPLQIQEGEVVWIPAMGLHWDPEYFPNPESFQPERFSEENKSNIKPFTYLPFGMGPRNCIGNRFALMEAKLTLVHLLSKFDIQVVDETPLPIKLTNSMLVKGGFWVGLSSRNRLSTS